MEAEKSDYVQIIDNYVESCVQHPQQFPYQRQILALYGYDFGQVSFQEPPPDNFLALVYEYQSQVKRLAKAIEDDDLEMFESLLKWQPREKFNSGLFETLLCWDGREGQENPMPMLHKAVVFNRISIVQVILSNKPRGQSIDTLFDHHRRTALHYAHSLNELNDIRLILRESGCSEHSLDRVRFAENKFVPLIS